VVASRPSCRSVHVSGCGGGAVRELMGGGADAVVGACVAVGGGKPSSGCGGGAGAAVGTEAGGIGYAGAGGAGSGPHCM